MIFVRIYSMPPEKRNAAQERFKKTGGPPRKRVEMIGRWHSASGGRGVIIFEADALQAVATWSQPRSDLIRFGIYPALDEASFTKLLG
jgi:Protein of unknown function (DUF3303)